MRRTCSLFISLIVLAACTDLSVDTPAATNSGIRVVNATTASVTMIVDGVTITGTLGAATVSARVPVGAGSYAVELRHGSTPGFTRTVTVTDDRTVTIVALDSAGSVTPAVLADTNSIVPAGATKLRVAHMASQAGPVSIWRTQPDFASPTRVQFPFPYRDVSPYLQSTPGDWRVMVSSEDNTAGPVTMPDTLANSGLITIGDGAAATVILVDQPGGGIGILVVTP